MKPIYQLIITSIIILAGYGYGYVQGRSDGRSDYYNEHSSQLKELQKHIDEAVSILERAKSFEEKHHKDSAATC